MAAETQEMSKKNKSGNGALLASVAAAMAGVSFLLSPLFKERSVPPEGVQHLAKLIQTKGGGFAISGRSAGQIVEAQTQNFYFQIVEKDEKTLVLISEKLSARQAKPQSVWIDLKDGSIDSKYPQTLSGQNAQNIFHRAFWQLEYKPSTSSE